MNFYSRTMLFYGIIIITGIIIIFILYLLNIREIKKHNKKLIELDILKSNEISRLNKTVNTLNNIIKNNEYNTELDYDNIYYYSAADRIVLSGGKIVAKEQYTTDITKAKNFAKYKNDYIEINKEDN